MKYIKEKPLFSLKGGSPLKHLLPARILSILLTVLLTVSAAACSSRPQPGQSSLSGSSAEEISTVPDSSLPGTAEQSDHTVEVSSPESQPEDPSSQSEPADPSSQSQPEESRPETPPEDPAAETLHLPGFALSASAAPTEDQVSQLSVPVQLTMEDIQAMNGDTVVIDIYNNRGYLSTLVGKFYDKPVRNAEDGVESIRGIASLLGLSKGCEFFAVYGETDNDGYTYYTYQQRYGGYTLQYATLRIVVDPEGYTAGLSCSFVPDVGIVEETAAITAAEAEQIVQNKSADFDLIYYPEHTVRLAATFDNVVHNCWVVYTNNPEATPSFDIPYIAHYVSTDGSYLTLIPTNDFASSNQDAQNVEGYFEGLQTETYTAEVTMADGSKKTLSLPISRNTKDGRYYLMDPSRLIAVARYSDFVYSGVLNFLSSTTPTGFTDGALLSYSNFIKAFDFYTERGLRSVDGFGRPILVTLGYCDQNGNPIDNECFYGINGGWACFAVSEANRDCDCLDMVTHEYTHGITNQSMQGIYYRNEQGAINESYSDIMGNLCEMICRETLDTEWLIAENSGDTMRDMKNPNTYEQPAFVGDEYYVAPVLTPSRSINDYGGVHVNNSLVGHMAYLLDASGMTPDEQVSMWMTSIEMLTPMSDYEDLHAILLFSLKINGLLQEYGPVLNRAFADAGLNEDWTVSYEKAAKEGCGRVTFQTDSYLAGSEVKVLFATRSGKVVSCAFPDSRGVVSQLLPAGSYICQLVLIEDNRRVNYNLADTGWTKADSFGTIVVNGGDTVTLPMLDTGRSGSSGGTDEPPEPIPPAQEGPLKLTRYNGGYYTITIPEGWKIEMYGYAGDYILTVYDPERPSRKVFYYAALAPLHKSEASRRYLNPLLTSEAALASAGPVLHTHHIGGVLEIWQECIDYQVRYGGRQIFPSLTPLDYIADAYEGPYAQVDGAIESAAVSICTAENSDTCYMGLAGTLFDLDIYNFCNGNWYYTLFDTVGIMLPEDEYLDYVETLAACIVSLEFTEEYIEASQKTAMPLIENELRQFNMELIVDAILEMDKYLE